LQKRGNAAVEAFESTGHIGMWPIEQAFAIFVKKKAMQTPTFKHHTPVVV
jgi:hypothetical protein